MNQTQITSSAARDAGQFLDIYATGGTNFCVQIIEDYDPAQPKSTQDGKFLGNIEFGDLDEEGQYLQDDDEVIEHAREQYDVAENIPAGVR
jgi:hypothetical protein